MYTHTYIYTLVYTCKYSLHVYAHYPLKYISTHIHAAERRTSTTATRLSYMRDGWVVGQCGKVALRHLVYQFFQLSSRIFGSPQVALFCGNPGLFCRNIRLFGRDLNFFGRDGSRRHPTPERERERETVRVFMSICMCVCICVCACEGGRGTSEG